MKRSVLVFVALDVCDCGIQNNIVCILVDDHSPNAIQKVPYATDAFHLPRLGCHQRPHEHFVQTQRISAVLSDNRIRVHDVSAALGHLFGFHRDLDVCGFYKRLAFAFFDLIVIQVVAIFLQDHGDFIVVLNTQGIDTRTIQT